jgi:hypothetical protein
MGKRHLILFRYRYNMGVGGRGHGVHEYETSSGYLGYF